MLSRIRESSRTSAIGCHRCAFRHVPWISVTTIPWGDPNPVHRTTPHAAQKTPTATHRTLIVDDDDRRSALGSHVGIALTIRARDKVLLANVAQVAYFTPAKGHNGVVGQRERLRLQSDPSSESNTTRDRESRTGTRQSEIGRESAGSGCCAFLSGRTGSGSCACLAKRSNRIERANLDRANASTARPSAT